MLHPSLLAAASHISRGPVPWVLVHRRIQSEWCFLLHRSQFLQVVSLLRPARLTPFSLAWTVAGKSVHH